jgi:cytosine/uracil/thiamine/allantoin permease
MCILFLAGPWFGANVSVLGLSYGAFALGFGISFWQALIAGVIGIVISFLLCGLIALAGKARFRPYPGARQPAVPALTRRRTRTVRSTGPYG